MSDELLFIIKCIRERNKNKPLSCARRFGNVITTKCIDEVKCDCCPMATHVGEYPDALIQLGDYLEPRTSSDS